MKKTLTWYYMFTKRLLRHYSFILILALIPVLLPVANSVMTRDSSVFKVALSAQDDNDAIAKRVIDRLYNSESVISYELYDSEEEAEEAVRMQKVDAAWVFVEGLQNKVELYTSTKGLEPLVNIYEFETDIRASLAREKLYGALFPDISYSLYSEFVRSEVLGDIQISDDELYKTYSGKNDYENIVKVETLDGKPVKKNSAGHLTGPLRGLFSVIIMLCGLSAAMFFLKDKQDGKYDYIPGKRRIVPSFGMCFAATILCGSAVYLALLISGTYTGFVRETISMIMYIICAAGFCALMTLVFDSPNRLGATLPFFIILTIALTPIFFNVKMLKLVSLMIPTYYYLHSIYNSTYLLYMVSYTLIIYTVVFALNTIKSKKG